MKIILVHSVYHIFYALSIAEKHEFKNVLMICSNSNPKKFELIFDIISSQFMMNVIKIQHDDKASKISVEDLEKIKAIKALSTDEFIIFNQDNLLALYLAKSFKKRGVKISLAQDALKAYAIIDKLAIKYRIERSFQFFKFLKINEFEFMPFFVNLNYGSFKFIDSLYLSHPNAYIFSDKDKFKQNMSTEVLNYFSILANNSPISFNKETVFFASSLLKYDDKQISIEINILKILSRRFSNHQKILKVHPRVSEEVLNELNKLEDWIIINDTYPAELLLNQFDKSFYVFSAYSGLSLFEPKNPSIVKMYWLYPMYGNSLKPLTYTKIIHPSDSIRILSSIEEVENL